MDCIDNQLVSNHTFCNSVSYQVDYLEQFFDNEPRKIDGFDVQSEINIERTNQHVSTKVVEMDMTGINANIIINRAREVAHIENIVKKILNKNTFNYASFSLEFELAALFYPECQQILSNNFEKMKTYMPNLSRCHCNVFFVNKHRPRYGTHHTSALGFEYGYFHNKNMYMPHEQMSFHTAITPTNESTGPFIMFEDHVPESTSEKFAFMYVKNMSSQSEISRIESLLSKAPYWRIRNDYLKSLYWKKKVCSRADKGGMGYYWNLKFGQALYFNNYRAHGDMLFGTQEHERLSLDMRCFSSQNESNWKNSVTRESKYSIILAECIPKSLGIDMELFYGDGVAAIQRTGSIMLGITNHSIHDMFHHDNKINTQRYYNAIDLNKFDKTVLKKCIKTHL